jgi:hypothetical protein
VVDRHRVLAEAAGWLDEHDDVAGSQGGEHDLVLLVHEQRAGRLAPRLGDVVHQVGREVSGPATVVVGTDPDMAAGELGGGEPLLVLAARGDERVDERVTGFGVASVMAWHVEETGDFAVVRTEVVPLLA